MDGQMVVNFVDVFALLALAAGAVVGFRRGLSDQLARPLSLLLGLLGALYAYTPMEDLVGRSRGLSPEMRGAAAIALTAIVTIVCMVLARVVLTRLIRLFVAQEAERIGGVVLGTVRAALAVLILFLLANIAPYNEVNRIVGEESLIGRQVARITPTVSRKLEELRLLHARQRQEAGQDEAPPHRASAAEALRAEKRSRAQDLNQIQDH